MSRYRNYGNNDERPTILGDDAFTGVNEKLSRELLPKGILARAINNRCRTGSNLPRPGTIKPAFANEVAYGTILGSGIYSNPNGPECLMLATPNTIYRVSDGSTPIATPIPAGEVLDTPSEFVQAFDKLLLFRGLDRIPLQWDGLGTGFEKITMATPDDTTKHLIPNAITAEVFQNRLLVPVDRDQVDLSDVLDYTQFDPILENWRINLGSADALVRIFPFANNGAIMFKERSIAFLANFTDPDHPENASLQVLNPSLGLAARRSPIMYGADVLFLSHTGIYRLNQIIQDRNQTAPVPVSDPIQPIINRINWRYAAGIVSGLLGEYCYWAVPLDGATSNNAMLVYNGATDNWETSYDNWAGAIQISNLHVTNYLGVQRLYAVDYATQKVYVLYEGQTDLLASGEYNVIHLLESRGYADSGQDPGLLNFRRAKVSIATWNPSLQITAIMDGTNEENDLTPTPIIRDRTKYFTFAQPDYDPSNANNDFLAPRREDYSLPIDAPGFFAGADGVAADLKQDTAESAPVERVGRWCSLRIQNSQGQCEVHGIELEANQTARELQTAA